MSNTLFKGITLKNAGVKSKYRVRENLFYIACPIFTKGGALAGYLSEVFENKGNGIVIYLQKLTYYTKIVEYNL